MLGSLSPSFKSWRGGEFAGGEWHGRSQSPRNHEAVPIAYLSVRHGVTGRLASAEATIEGLVELPKAHVATVVNKRYDIITKGGVVSTDPPTTVVYLEGSFARPQTLPMVKTRARRWLPRGSAIHGAVLAVLEAGGIGQEEYA